MPANRPQASFEPIPPDLDLDQLVESTPNFQYCDRLSYHTIAENGIEQFEKLVQLHVIKNGKPLIIDGFEEKLDPWTFTPKWLRDNHGTKVEMARNITTKENIQLTIGHYLSHMGTLTNQFFDKLENFKDKNRQRIYLKDIDCPQVWQEKLKDFIPGSVFYWNDGTGEIGGAGAAYDHVPHATVRKKGRGIAPSGDLMSSLPQEMRAENLMCYIGHEGTYTASHREMCATLGHNIMVDASREVDQETGQAEHPGSSIWFMTESRDRQTVAEYWLSVLGHDIELENHFAQIAAWQRAPFTTYVVDQRVGDFVLIPPLAPHQVWNRGTRTMKVAWNRTTVDTLEMAMAEALPKARLVCRDEQYKNKAIIYYTLLKYSGLIHQATSMANRSEEERIALHYSRKYRQLQKDFKALFGQYRGIMLSESFAKDTKEHVEYAAFDGNVTCSYCRCNIFNRFLTCKACPSKYGGDDPYDTCMDCFVMGRGCECQSNYYWVEQFKWKDLVSKYEEWRRQILELDTVNIGVTLLALGEERRLYSGKTLAQICQEQIKIRPFKNIYQESPPEPEDASDEEEVQMNNDGTVKRVIKKRSKDFEDKNKRCHVCFHHHPKWKMAMCTACQNYWCYGALFRAHDLMPYDIMADPHWECPHCRGVCSTGRCRKLPDQRPYQPKGTNLGYDTKRVADPRSVEVLVDFRVSNIQWIREQGLALEQRQFEAENDRLNSQAAQFDQNYELEMQGATGGHIVPQITYAPEDMIDPELGGGVSNSNGSIAANGEAPGQPTQEGGPVNEDQLDHDVSAYPDLEPYAPQTDYVDPNSVLFEHVDPSNPKPPVKGKGKKRAPADQEPIKLVQRNKRRKVTTEDKMPTKNKASKQFQQEQHKKQLSDARREGRYLFVWSRLNKKDLVVTLNLPSAELARIQQEDSARQAQRQVKQREANILIRSDIAQPRAAAPEKTAAQPLPKKQSYKARVEDDGDFRARRGRGKKTKKRFEEITVEDDSEEEFMQEMAANNAKKETNRRRSDWRAKRDQEDEDLPVELPDNWKDGSVNRPRKARSTPNIRGAAEKSNDEDGGEEVDENNHVDLTNAQDESEEDDDYDQTHLTLDQDLGQNDDDDDDDGEGGADEEAASTPQSNPSSAGPTIGSSIFNRANGRNIKIAGASSKKNVVKGTSRRGPPGRTSLPG